MNIETMALQAFIKSLNLDYTASKGADDGWYIKLANSSGTLETIFVPEAPLEDDKPSLLELMRLLTVVSLVLNQSTFEEWATHWTYDPDSIKAFAIYHGFRKLALALQTMLGNQKLVELRDLVALTYSQGSCPEGRSVEAEAVATKMKE